VKIVSGDDHTVAAIGRATRHGGRRPASGLALSALDDDRLGEVAEADDDLRQVDPYKARLVTVLKARGRYVAAPGDGVNDILPVRTADVGVAMQSGSPATRGVADLVLVRDDFSILPEAIRDGQRIVAAMAATLTVLLARTFYVLLIIVGASLLQLPFPFTPRQNSILALITVGVPILVLALWVRPSPSRAGLLGQTLRISIPLSFGVVAVALPVYAVSLLNGASARSPDDPHDARELRHGALLVPIAAGDRGRVGCRRGASRAGRIMSPGISPCWRPIRTRLSSSPAVRDRRHPARHRRRLDRRGVGIHRTRIVQRGIDVLIAAGSGYCPSADGGDRRRGIGRPGGVGAPSSVRGPPDAYRLRSSMAEAWQPFERAWRVELLGIDDRILDTAGTLEPRVLRTSMPSTSRQPWPSVTISRRSSLYDERMVEAARLSVFQRRRADLRVGVRRRSLSGRRPREHHRRRWAWTTRSGGLEFASASGDGPCGGHGSASIELPHPSAVRPTAELSGRGRRPSRHRWRSATRAPPFRCVSCRQTA
jgi:hypothetical protein